MFQSRSRSRPLRRRLLPRLFWLLRKGQMLTALTQLNFGTQAATNASVVGNTQIQATSPANAALGPVNLTAYFSSGWLALAPNAFSYGPQIVQVLPNAA